MGNKEFIYLAQKFLAEVDEGNKDKLPWQTHDVGIMHWSINQFYLWLVEKNHFEDPEAKDL